MNKSTLNPALTLPEELQGWIESSLASKSNILATSNQGTVLLFEGDGLKLIIKSAMGRGAVRRARQATLERENSAYQRMHGVVGVPASYGFLDKQFLVMEFIDGIAYRQAKWPNEEDRTAWFDQLLSIIQTFHARGVSHGDLKSKTNLIAGVDGKPYIIDFGTTFIHKDGFHPINNHFFKFGKRLDINAWVKHKYRGKYGNASEADQKLLDYSKLEYWVRKIRGRPMH
jgi:predicted Ser/Thr protein kinase